MEQSHGDWQGHRDVLCVRLDAIGDVLMTTPAIRALREQRADRRIALLTSSAGAQVAALVPEIDEIVAYDPPWMKAPGRDDPALDRAMVERLRAREHDAAAIFTVFSQSALPAATLCRLAGIPHRLAHCREKPYALLSDWVPEREPEQGIRHEVRRQLDLVATVGASTDCTRLSLDVPADAVASALAALDGAGHDPAEPWLLAHPGSTAESRRYPAELYADALARLARRSGRRVVLTGAERERPLVEGLAAELGDVAVALAGELSLAELCGLIAAAPLLVCNNSAPAHVAAAVQTPVVVLYALTNPQHTPWHVASRVLSHDVPCRWCQRSVCPEGHHACLRLVAPADVAQAALELLGGDRSDRGSPLPWSGAVAPRV